MKISKVSINFQELLPQTISLYFYKNSVQSHVHTFANDCNEVSSINCTPYDMNQNKIEFTILEGLSVDSLEINLMGYHNDSIVSVSQRNM